MPSPALPTGRWGRRVSPGILAGVMMLVTMTGIGHAETVTASLEADVPAGTWKTTRLSNLPKGVSLDLRIVSDGPVSVALVDKAELDRPRGRRRPLFFGELTDRIDFSITTKRAGDHYLIIDNRNGGKTRHLRIEARASRDSEATANALLERFETAMHRLFRFDPIRIRAGHCRSPSIGAYAQRNEIVLCGEYVTRLYEELGGKRRTQDVVLFALFHEMGHILLRQWDYPMYDSEEVADDFAAALMVMLGKRRQLTTVGRMFNDRALAREAVGRAVEGDGRHPLSEQRARRILRWQDTDAPVRQWQSLFVPHMQTALLERLRDHPTAWSDPELVRRELEARKNERTAGPDATPPGISRP